MRVGNKLLMVLLLTSGLLGGCVSTVISETTGAALAVAKVPFQVGGAIVDVVTGDDE